MDGWMDGWIQREARKVFIRGEGVRKIEVGVVFWSSGVGASEGSRARAEARYFRAPAPAFATGVPAYLRDWDPFRMWESFACLLEGLPV